MKRDFTIYSTSMKSVIMCLFCSVFFSNILFCQASVTEVNYELIPYKSVQTYIQSRTDEFKSFLDIKPTWTSSVSENEFNHQEKTYLIKEDISEVWDKYRNTSPAVSWNGKKVMFGFMFSKKQNKPIYCGQPISKIDTGQVIFLNLKLLKFYNLAMAFEIISVDTDNKVIEFSYIEGNVSSGKQSLQFVETEKGYTKIIHSSYFKSESKLRDRLLYPYFHVRTTNEFHRTMKKLIYNAHPSYKTSS